MREFSKTRALFYINVVEGDKLVPKFYRVENDPQRTGGYKEQAVDNT